VTPAVVHLESLGISHRVLEYPHDPANRNFGLEAAERLGLDPDRVFKTLIVVPDGPADGRFVAACAVVPVSMHLSLKALAAAVGVKRVAMSAPDGAERLTGYLVGGISPIGQRRRLPTVIDETAALFDEVFVSGGRRGLDLGLAPDDLAVATGAVFADIAVTRPTG
jgi:Cys-tRNA(Pro)/Cys-tRNA(Cys) deacylase